MAEIFVYGRNVGGGRNIGVDLDGVRVLVESHSPETDAAADRVARQIAERHDANVVAAGERAEHRRVVASLTGRIDIQRARARSAESALASAIEGRRRFFGPVLLVAGRDGWGGEVWLMDPEKRERGSALTFGSLAALRAAHPELWVVCPDGDGILMDVCAIPRVESDV